MAETQPPTIVEGATTGDVDDEIPVTAKSAEDRKAAAALSSLDAPREDDSAGTKDVDQEAVRKAMERLGGSAKSNGTVAKKDNEVKVVKKTVKVDPADVTLLVCRACSWTLDLQLPKSFPPSLLVLCIGEFLQEFLPRILQAATASKPSNPQLCSGACTPANFPLLQIEELELSKIKATDLLKAHDGDAGKALKAFIAPAA